MIMIRARAVIIHNDKVLVVRNIARNNYCFPGGGGGAKKLETASRGY